MKKARKRTKAKAPAIELAPEHRIVNRELASLACIAKKMRPFTANGIANALNTAETVDNYLDLLHVLIDRYGRQMDNVNLALIKLKNKLKKQKNS